MQRLDLSRGNDISIKRCVLRTSLGECLLFGDGLDVVLRLLLLVGLRRPQPPHAIR